MFLAVTLLMLPLRAQQDQATDNGPKLEPLRTSVTVVGEIKAETPTNITILNPLDLEEIPGVSMDDKLRMVPGFSLFRRSSSLVANPTTQGVSLRGIGSSGASRTLVLWDGVPVNDPFGGWVQWPRFAPEEIARVEVLRGASTKVFGDRAMSGAIAMFSPSAERTHYAVGYDIGNANQSLLTASFAQAFQQFAISGDFRGYTTSGYYIVPSQSRGLVDTKAGVDFLSPYLRFDYFSGKQRFYLKTDIYMESRDNGTVLQGNSTSMGTISAHYEGGTVNNFSLLGYHTREGYRQSFSAVFGGRNSERLTSRQFVPSQAAGGALMYRRSFTSMDILAGADAVRVEGTSNDFLVPSGIRVGGGDQLQHGAFGQLSAHKGPLRMILGLRHQFTGQGSTFLSPSAGLTYGLGALRFHGSVYRSFRAPTLNELYREFRAGTAITQANPNLHQEGLTGVEAGADWVGETRRLGVSVFRNAISDIITNVTLSVTPTQTIRQRRNAAAALSRGAEVDFRQRFGPWNLELSYLLADSRYRTGPRIAQVPKHQGSGQLSYVRGKTLATFGLRSLAWQFEDDLNTRLSILPGFAVLQFSVRQRLAKGFSLQAEMENMLDRQFYVGWAAQPTATIAGIPNTGAPRLWRLGMRWER